MKTEILEDADLELLTRPAGEEAFPEPVIEDEDLSDEVIEEIEAEEGVNVIESVVEEPAVLAAPDPMVLIAKLQAELDALKKAPKNQTAGVPGNRSYVRVGSLNTEGKIPQQQADLAKILTENMKVGEKYTEAQVFAFLNDAKPNFPSLMNSRQDVTYLFRYYKGLKKSGKHEGFVGRRFLRQS